MSESKMSRIGPEDAPAFLADTGLLFEINRMVLHPLGLALEVIVNDETDRPERFGGLWDYRHEPEGIRFAAEAFADGLKKFNAFMGEFGTNKHLERERVLGYLIQDEEDGDE